MNAEHPPSELWSLVCSAEYIEELSELLFNAGACGVEVLDPSRVRCFFEGPAAACAAFRSAVEEFGIATEAPIGVPRENWVQRCAEVWQPLIAGALTIVPVVDGMDAAPTRLERELYLVPGEGFGTGHHATTKTALELLQHPSLESCRGGAALDVGAGSGILAIAMAQLLGCTAIALEIDPLAISNARKNIALNDAAEQVLLINGSLPAVSGVFNLIAANIYAEVLCSMERGFYERLTPNGCLILSGIMESKLALIDQSFQRAAWRPVERRIVDGWATMLLIRGS